MQYNSGRNDRDSVHANGTGAIMVFEHSKAWMCNKGVRHNIQNTSAMRCSATQQEFS